MLFTPKGYVTPVKDQRQCVSSWAFSATGAVEGAHFRATGNLVSLSEQNLMDCVHPFEDGCDGGSTTDAFRYVLQNGIMSEIDYHYKARDSGFGVCNFASEETAATIDNFNVVGYQNELALQNDVANMGPVSVAIDASRPSFQLYHEGVYSDLECSSDDVNHDMLAVGYGTAADGKDYWLVKNSWGETWGMEGYMMMARNQDNMCGIATDASYPTAAA